jgi:hypothetical protein
LEIGGIHSGEIMPRKGKKKKAKQKQEDPQWYEDDNLWLDLLTPLFLNYDGHAELAAKLFHRLAK